jgi:hypothetical protein
LNRLVGTGSLLIVIVAAWATVSLSMPLAAWTPPPIELEPEPDERRDPRPPRSLSQLAVIWQRDLRQSVVDLPPVPRPAVPEAKLAIELVGTAIEADRQYGLFRLANNTTTVKSVGSTIEGYRIVAIERGRARVRSGGREYELKVPWYDRLRKRSKE